MCTLDEIYWTFFTKLGDTYLTILFFTKLSPELMLTHKFMFLLPQLLSDIRRCTKPLQHNQSSSLNGQIMVTQSLSHEIWAEIMQYFDVSQWFYMTSLPIFFRTGWRISVNSIHAKQQQNAAKRK